METRLAIFADLPDLAELHAECFSSARWSMDQISQTLGLDASAVFVAFDAQKVVGFIACQFAGDDAEILTFCVRPSKRKQGVGYVLLKRAIDEALRRNSAKVFLEVAEDNLAALALYRHMGFCRTGLRPRYYSRGTNRVDAWIMSKDLAAPINVHDAQEKPLPPHE